MGIPFVGGPYDGREIEDEVLFRHARFEDVTGDLGKRVFALMPPPGAWGALVRGDESAGPKYAYEQVSTPDGVRFVWPGSDGLEAARREAKLAVHPRAKTALGTFSSDLRDQIVRVVAGLTEIPRGEWVAHGAVHLLESKPIYLVKLPRPYQAFVRVRDDGRVELFDIFHEETIQQFAEKYAVAGAPR